jgi:LAGLIDADG endonuclease
VLIVEDFKVSDLDNLFNLANIFNGNLFLDHRIEQLETWIQILNQKGYNINFIPDRVSISLSDGWLSGFTDAEGCFNVTVAKRAAMLLGFRVILRFIIDQNDNNALISIQNLFGYGGVNFRSETASCYRYEVTNLNNVPSIIKYLSNFPLKT